MIEFIIGAFIRPIVVPLASRFAEFAAPAFPSNSREGRNFFSPTTIRFFRMGITSLGMLVAKMLLSSCRVYDFTLKIRELKIGERERENNGIYLFFRSNACQEIKIDYCVSFCSFFFFCFYRDSIVLCKNIDININRRKQRIFTRTGFNNFRFRNY